MRKKLVKLTIALEELDIKTIQELLDKCRTRASRREFVKALEITDVELEKLVKIANLMRVEGIDEKDAKLLIKVGIDSVKELSRRNAQNLYKKFEDYAETKKIKIPKDTEIENWIEQAKLLSQTKED